MPDPINVDTPKEPKKSGALDSVISALKLEWIRPLMYNLGGRKLAAGGAGLAIITQVINSTMADWPKAVVCLSVALISVGTSFAIASEDKKVTPGSK